MLGESHSIKFATLANQEVAEEEADNSHTTTRMAGSVSTSLLIVERSSIMGARETRRREDTEILISRVWSTRERRLLEQR